MDWDSCQVVTNGLLPWWETCTAKQWHELLPETKSGNSTASLRVHKLLSIALSLPSSCWKLTSTPLYLPTTNGLFPPHSTPEIPIFVRIGYLDFSADILELKLHRFTISYLVFAYDYFLEKSYPMRFTGRELKTALKARFLRGCLEWRECIGCEGLKAAVGHLLGQGDFVEWSEERVKSVSIPLVSATLSSPSSTPAFSSSSTSLRNSSGVQATPLTNGERQVIHRLREICAVPSSAGDDGREKSKGVLGYLRNLFIPALEEERNIWGIKYTIPAQGWDYEPYFPNPNQHEHGYPIPKSDHHTSPSSSSIQSSTPSIGKLFPAFCQSLGVPIATPKRAKGKRPANIGENSRGGKVRFQDRGRGKYLPGTRNNYDVTTTVDIVEAPQANGGKRRRLHSTCTMAELHLSQSASAYKTSFSAAGISYGSISTPYSPHFFPNPSRQITQLDEDYDNDIPGDEEADGRSRHMQHEATSFQPSTIPQQSQYIHLPSFHPPHNYYSHNYYSHNYNPNHPSSYHYSTYYAPDYNQQQQDLPQRTPPMYWPPPPHGHGPTSGNVLRRTQVTTTEVQEVLNSSPRFGDSPSSLGTTPSPKTIPVARKSRKPRAFSGHEDDDIFTRSLKRTAPVSPLAEKSKRRRITLGEQMELPPSSPPPPPKSSPPPLPSPPPPTSTSMLPSTPQISPIPLPASPLPSPRLPKVAKSPKGYSKHRRAMYLARQQRAAEEERSMLEEQFAELQRQRHLQEAGLAEQVRGKEEGQEEETLESVKDEIPLPPPLPATPPPVGSPITAIYIDENSQRIEMVKTPVRVNFPSAIPAVPSPPSPTQAPRGTDEADTLPLPPKQENKQGARKPPQPQPQPIFYPVKCDDESRWEHIEPGWYEPISSSPPPPPLVIPDPDPDPKTRQPSEVTVTMSVSQNKGSEGRGEERVVKMVISGEGVVGGGGDVGGDKMEDLSPKSKAKEFIRKMKSRRLWVNGGEWAPVATKKAAE